MPIVLLALPSLVGTRDMSTGPTGTGRVFDVPRSNAIISRFTYSLFRKISARIVRYYLITNDFPPRQT